MSVIKVHSMINSEKISLSATKFILSSVIRFLSSSVKQNQEPEQEENKVDVVNYGRQLITWPLALT